MTSAAARRIWPTVDGVPTRSPRDRLTRPLRAVRRARAASGAGCWPRCCRRWPWRAVCTPPRLPRRRPCRCSPRRATSRPARVLGRRRPGRASSSPPGSVPAGARRRAGRAPLASPAAPRRAGDRRPPGRAPPWPTGDPAYGASRCGSPTPAMVGLLRVGDRIDLLATDPQGGGARRSSRPACLVLADPAAPTTAAGGDGLPGALVVVGVPTDDGDRAGRRRRATVPDLRVRPLACRPAAHRRPGSREEEP